VIKKDQVTFHIIVHHHAILYYDYLFTFGEQVIIVEDFEGEQVIIVDHQEMNRPCNLPHSENKDTEPWRDEQTLYSHTFRKQGHRTVTDKNI
jgi:hypothetical protein